MELVNGAIDRESDPDIQLILSSMLDRMRLLNNVYTHLRKIIIAQIEWLKHNEDLDNKDPQGIQEFLRLVKEESFLLYEHGLSGDRNERDLLKEIYDETMPLRERIKIKRLDEGATCAPLLIEPAIAGTPYVLKKYGGSNDWILNVIKRGLTLEEAKQRKRVTNEYYDYYRNAGINVPPRGAFAVISHGKNNYQVALKEEFIHNNVEDIFRTSTTSKELIIEIYEKLLDIAYKDLRAGHKYLSDFFLRNFCIRNGEVFYIDTDPPLYQFEDKDGEIHFKLVGINEGFAALRKLQKQRNFGLTGKSSDQLSAAEERAFDNWIFRLSTPHGNLFYIIVWSIVVRPDMEEDFKRTMLDFLSRRRLRQLYNYCNALFSDKKFKEYVETKKQSFKPRIDKIPT
ncbi:MAG: hypothetical protein QGI89_03085 [Candidatus Woesearchaeota archaeon]|nr:hypothetical protein [Candidatus Woesearchaeota archaeon]MDP7322339.1 hypothetical protein [Candidatus Woesearchaeota archaeon]HJO01628.1 hypothetical protein [Candidatus Woesearchaeota archaeon]